MRVLAYCLKPFSLHRDCIKTQTIIFFLISYILVYLEPVASFGDLYMCIMGWGGILEFQKNKKKNIVLYLFSKHAKTRDLKNSYWYFQIFGK